MIIAWSNQGWEDYLHWQQHDKQLLKRINNLIKDIQRHPFAGLGDPEPLKHHWSGYWSRRINIKYRLVYKVADATLIVVQCRYHY
jgi:toxin YoeB